MTQRADFIPPYSDVPDGHLSHARAPAAFLFQEELGALLRAVGSDAGAQEGGGGGGMRVR